MNPHQVTKDFEEAVAQYTGAPYCVAVNSCTNALFLSLMWKRKCWAEAGVLDQVPARVGLPFFRIVACRADKPCHVLIEVNHLRAKSIESNQGRVRVRLLGWWARELIARAAGRARSLSVCSSW